LLLIIFMLVSRSRDQTYW